MAGKIRKGNERVESKEEFDDRTVKEANGLMKTK